MRTDPCPRCGIGIDDDNDGNCIVCCRMTDTGLLRFLRNEVIRLKKQVKVLTDLA